ncbi:hypothetical protein OIV83_003300 [Microbotryomycetes sp. JL201]|nr:hypothetical protein OIV83_003300 [Microbotryomycetes sp. JL201]
MAVRRAPTETRQDAQDGSSSNMRLFALGVLLALASVAYAQLPVYLPRSVGARLPFVGSNTAVDKRGGRWSRLLAYQQTVPVAKNHDPFDVQGPADELRLRLLSKEGQSEQTKHDKRVQRDLSNRDRINADENRIHSALPVYFVEQVASDAAIDPSSSLGKQLGRIGDEIMEHVRPQTVVILSSKKSDAEHVTVTTLDSLVFSAPSLASQSVRGDSRLASYLLATFAHATPAVSATSGPAVLESPAGPVFAAMFDTGRRPRVVAVTLPVSSSRDRGWNAEQMYNVGHALDTVRHARDDVVIIGIGSTRPPTGSFNDMLQDALAHHTRHPRHNVLSSLYNGSKGSKPTKSVSSKLAALYASVGAAGESEGESLDDRGRFWRFGQLPFR